MLQYRWVNDILRYAAKPWYPIAVGLAAGLDHFLLVIPTDGIMIVSVLVMPRRWVRFAVAAALGSSLGCLLLAGALQHFGISVLQWASPDIMSSEMWQTADGWADRFGLWALFFSGALPIPQHPAIAIEALSGADLREITGVFLAGRIVKYMVIGWLASHAPDQLTQRWPFRKEIKEVGIEAPRTRD